MCDGRLPISPEVTVRKRESGPMRRMGWVRTLTSELWGLKMGELLRILLTFCMRRTVHLTTHGPRMRVVGLRVFSFPRVQTTFGMVTLGLSMVWGVPIAYVHSLHLWCQCWAAPMDDRQLAHCQPPSHQGSMPEPQSVQQHQTMFSGSGGGNVFLT